MKKHLLIIISITLLFSCTSPEKRLEKKLFNTIKDYMAANTAKTDIIDSISIIDIDTLTPATYMFLYNESLQNKIEDLNQQYAYAMDDGNDSLADIIGKKNIATFNKIDSCEKALKSPSLDKSSVWGYFVITKVYIHHPDNEKEIIDIGFPITKEFIVKELDL